MKLDITNYHFEELIKSGYSIDMVVMLDWINRNLSVEEMCKNSIKIKTIYTALIRKGLVTKEGDITENGVKILDFVSKKTNKKLVKRVAVKDDFEEWWKIFPSTDIFEYKGRKFEGSRSLRTGKEKCRLLFNKYVLEKKYTKEEIINATLYDVELKKANSFRSGDNKLQYLNNSHTYLLQEVFEPFIKFGKPKTQSSSTRLGSMDI